MESFTAMIVFIIQGLLDFQELFSYAAKIVKRNQPLPGSRTKELIKGCKNHKMNKKTANRWIYWS